MDAAATTVDFAKVDHIDDLDPLFGKGFRGTLVALGHNDPTGRYSQEIAGPKFIRVGNNGFDTQALQLFQEKLSAYLAGQKEQSNSI